ncbi:hypothetical protein AWH62_02715 [Maricaulis sp. W15]|uniref:Flagellar basal-body/hook protein C-terminal domain-containing protein n=1 Tax=Maricaulis maris TaxID=74318 RepID=A0A495DM79_9PROT|nr:MULTISPECIES: hypothetical protein [Maricaulis]OLF81599.1 hypothetical protein AWH62_02715 [Maricaulis sp. W15]RKR04015.1 hypothetical protein C7435_0458 [Maricaulis maris]
MNVAFNTAVAGMMSAQSHAGEAARQAVNNAAKGEDIIQAAVALKKAEAAHSASAVMARTAAELTDTLLDITV